MTLQIMPTKLEMFIDAILADDPYSFSRYGDGEWKAIFREPGSNCDNHQYFPKMGAMLEESVCNPIPDDKFIYSLQGLANRTQNFEIDEMVGHLPITWYNSDVFHKAFAHGMMGHMVNALRTKKVCLVGPEYLSHRKLRFLRTGGMVVIPEVDCFLDIDRIHDEILVIQDRFDILAFSASMMTNVSIYELFSHLGQEKWMIDFGSVWDPCVGKNSRTVHKTYSKDLIEGNLG